MFRVWLALVVALLFDSGSSRAQIALSEVPPAPIPPTVAVPDGLALMAAIEQTTTAAIAKAERSVVAIARVRRDRVPASRVMELRIPENGGFETVPDNPDFVPSNFGSGVVISADGFIVTCAHVLDDPRQNDYYVWLDKRVYPV